MQWARALVVTSILTLVSLLRSLVSISHRPLARMLLYHLSDVLAPVVPGVAVGVVRPVEVVLVGARESVRRVVRDVVYLPGVAI